MICEDSLYSTATIVQRPNNNRAIIDESEINQSASIMQFD